MATGFTILSINVSKKKGTRKKPVKKTTLIKDHGIEGDGHAGPWHRQVSLLASEDVERVRLLHQDLDFDYHTENITTRGVDLSALPVGTRLYIGEAVLEITQVGKNEGYHHAIEEQPREYVNRRKGVFAKVVEGGDISSSSPCRYAL